MEDDEESKPPVFVYFDIEAMQVGGKHEPNLLIAETEDSDIPVIFEGADCVKEFLEWLKDLTEEDSPQVTIIAHNRDFKIVDYG